jgi:hypothetical protein
VRLFGESAVYADCKPVSPKRLQEGGVVAQTLHSAASIKRFLEIFFDDTRLCVASGDDTRAAVLTVVTRVVVPFSPLIALILIDGHALVEPESENRFSWNIDAFATCQSLDARAGRTACERSDGRSFPSAGDCAEDGSQQRGDSHVFAGAAVNADAFLPALRTRDVRCGNGIVFAVDSNPVKVHCHLIAGDPADDQFGLSATPDNYVAISVADVACHLGVEDSAGTGVPTVDPFVGSNLELSSFGDTLGAGTGGEAEERGGKGNSAAEVHDSLGLLNTFEQLQGHSPTGTTLRVGPGLRASCGSPQHLISGNVLARAAIANEAFINRDCSIFATASEADGLGTLAELFHEMMHQVHRRDAA